MAIKIGSNNITKAYLGSNLITKLYLGTKIIWINGLSPREIFKARVEADGGTVESLNCIKI